MKTAENNTKNIAYIVMGVCGVGKTSVSKDLADRIGARYVEADDFHPKENIEAMQNGVPLSDEMRIPWLHGLAKAVEAARQDGDVIVACSALKRKYRDIIRDQVRATRIIFLTGDRDLIARRLAARGSHFMPPSLLASQLETLEKPAASENVLEIDVAGSRGEVAERIEHALRAEIK